MTEDYLNNITPDSLSGLIFGFEGIRHALTILNGPTGCKFYNSITVENQSARKDDFDPLKFPEVWFFGQGRVPCTYLDKRDYVYGSDDKLSDAIKTTLARMKPEILCIVNSPGAALIGDDLERIAKKAVDQSGYSAGQQLPEDRKDQSDKPYLPVITCQSPGYSKDVTDGYKTACFMVLDEFLGDADSTAEEDGNSLDKACSAAGSDHAPTVNLIGLSIYQKYHTGDINEITRLLEACGVKVNTALLCECTTDEIRNVPKADLNIVVNTDWGLDIAKELKKRFGTPYVYSEYGYPVGFKAMEELITDVCSTLRESCSDFGAVDPEPTLEIIRRARAQAYIHIARMNSLIGLPKGVPYYVYAEPAMKRGYTSFLTDYLGMKETEDDPEIILGDGNAIARAKAEGKKLSGIEISLPTIGYIDVIEKTHLGAAGGLLLIEQILNSFIY